MNGYVYPPAGKDRGIRNILRRRTGSAGTAPPSCRRPSRQTQVTGKKHFIIIVSEGVVGAQELANQIQAATGVDSRATVLGHIQRGGSPTVRDRVNASLMGYHAIDLLDKGIYNRVVAVSGDKIVDYDVNVALSMHKTIDRDMIEIAKAISI